MNHHALILVDIQNDFLPGGALAVPEGDQIIPIANELMERIPLVVATQDWHPADHGSFASNHPGSRIHQTIHLHGLPQTLWPDHCVQGTPGAEFAADLHTQKITRIFQKGTNRDIDSYSGLYDNGHRQSTGLGEWLRTQGITHLTICGLATDYCVKFTAVDAVKDGFQVTLHLPACRGVNLTPGDVGAAVQEMENKGVTVMR